MSIRVAIVGPTGYTGLHLIELLLRHPGAHLTYLASRREEPTHIAEVFPRLQGRVADSVAVCRPIDPEEITKQADVVFLAMPHRVAMSYVPQLLDAGLRVIDLSADYRLSDVRLYEQTYQHAHQDAVNLAGAVYGLPELFRDQLPNASLVANPGCYPTAAALALTPLLRSAAVTDSSIVINAASGVTGAGRNPAAHLHFPEQNEAFGPYGRIGAHRHQPEIEQTLSTVAGHSVGALFVPHLLPVDRGILETIYIEPVDADVSEEELFEVYERAYEDHPFVRVRNDLPNIKQVVGTNFCDLTVRVVTPHSSAANHGDSTAASTASTPTRVIVFAALDNMIKGASGQAIQNMNLMFGQEEKAGLL